MKSKRTLVISDLHLAVNRTGGTTQTSLEALRAYAHDKHRELLQLAVTHHCDTVLVNGDLCDHFSAPLSEALTIYSTADEFLSGNPDKELVYATGNHDLSKSSATLGTVAFLGALLQMKYPGRFRLITKPERLGDSGYVIPHLANQDLWSLEVSRIPEGVRTLFLHTNFDSAFAMQSDNSLNLSRDLAKELKAKGITMILGHEHQQKESLGGSVVIVGNNFPTSCSDCIGSVGKRALILDGDAISFIPTWTPDDADGWYAEVDWTELKGVEEEGRGFIRVNGSATAAEAADVVKAISAFRQRSQSFVITNAVAIEQTEGLEELASSIEDIRNVDVLSMLLELLDPAQREAIEKLTKETS